MGVTCSSFFKDENNMSENAQSIEGERKKYITMRSRNLEDVMNEYVHAIGRSMYTSQADLT